MKVNVSPYKYREIKDIPVGANFVFTSEVYLRIKDNRCPIDDNSVRAVKLSTGEVHYFGAKVRVYPVDCVVTDVKEDENET